MEEANDVQALEKISSEVDESQIKVILSNQCIKAQAFLLDKLKKQAERHKETCGFISSANLKLEAEIKHSEHEISGMLIAQETIKLAIIEIKKEWLIAKERKTDVIERIEEGKRRYEALWLECKTRYESIPFVQKLLRATEKVETLKNEIEDLDKQITTLYEDMKTQREICINLDKKRSIELADFIVNEKPNIVKTIKDKSEEIDKITKEITEMFNDQNVIIEDTVTKLTVEADYINTYENNEDIKAKNDFVNKNEEDSLIPKLELANDDLDFIDVNMEQVKRKKNEILNATPMATDSVNKLEKNKFKDHREEAAAYDYNISPYLEKNKFKDNPEEAKAYDYNISPYFNSYKTNEKQNISKRKLINILEDIHINKNEAYDIVKKVNPEKLLAVDEISSEVVDVKTTLTSDKDKGNMPIENDTIEEVDMTNSYADNIIIPPTQFLDMALADGTAKKRVSFEIPSSLQINEIIDDIAKENDNDGNETANQTINSQLDVSVASEDSFMKIKDMILKKHNLDLSPQFVYAKNPVLQKTDDDKIVTSKFFPNSKEDTKTGITIDNNYMEMDEEPKIHEPEEKQEQKNLDEQKSPKDDVIPMDVDAMIVSSPKENKIDEVQRSEKSVTGLLFTHGTQVIPDSLNASISTTGFEDSDFPHCIDSSLLLSPKPDVPVTGENPDVQSQEVPNFLSGFRKTGLSFFGGGASSSEPNADSSAQSDGNNFSFNFGGEKKSRGGLFSLFQ